MQKTKQGNMQPYQLSCTFNSSVPVGWIALTILHLHSIDHPPSENEITWVHDTEHPPPPSKITWVHSTELPIPENKKTWIFGAQHRITHP